MLYIVLHAQRLRLGRIGQNILRFRLLRRSLFFYSVCYLFDQGSPSRGNVRCIKGKCWGVRHGGKRLPGILRWGLGRQKIRQFNGRVFFCLRGIFHHGQQHAGLVGCAKIQRLRGRQRQRLRIHGCASARQGILQGGVVAEEIGQLVLFLCLYAGCSIGWQARGFGRVLLVNGQGNILCGRHRIAFFCLRGRGRHD